MRVTLQKVSHANVIVNGETTGAIDNGIVVLAGFENEDTEEDLEWIARKILNMRIFEDQDGKMNLSLKENGGNLLVISQFTLHASYKKGNRPSFIYAADPEIAENLYHRFVQKCNELMGHPVETGKFGEMMKVNLCNDGPVTINMDSKNKE